MSCEKLGNACDAFLEAQEEFIRVKGQLERFLTPLLERVGLTPMQAAVLNLIKKRENMTVTELFRTLDFNQGNMSSLCKKLEAMEYIKKTKLESDVRKTHLSLTEKGEAALSEIRRELSFEPDECWLSREELERAEEALRTLKEIAAKVNGLFGENMKKGDGETNA